MKLIWIREDMCGVLKAEINEGWWGKVRWTNQNVPTQKHQHVSNLQVPAGGHRQRSHYSVLVCRQEAANCSFSKWGITLLERTQCLVIKVCLIPSLFSKSLFLVAVFYHIYSSLFGSFCLHCLFHSSYSCHLPAILKLSGVWREAKLCYCVCACMCVCSYLSWPTIWNSFLSLFLSQTDSAD